LQRLCVAIGDVLASPSLLCPLSSTADAAHRSNLSSVNMSTSIPKNMITARFDGSNLDIWAPQVRRAADLLNVGYLFDETEIDFSDQAKRIEASKALVVITLSVTPAVDEVIRSLKKRDWDPTTAAAQVPLPGTQPAPGTTSTAAPNTSILAHTASTASSAGKTTLPAMALSFIDYANKKILAPDFVWRLLFALYGQRGLAAINKEIVAILQARIPADQSPQRAIDDLMMHFDRCNQHKPGMLLQTALGLIIMAKLPARYDTIMQDVIKSNMAVSATIRDLAIAIYEGAQSFKHSAPRNSGQANSANAVKHKPAGDPQWRGGNSGSLGSKPRFNAKKTGNGARSNAPRDSDSRNKRDGKPPCGPNRSGKGPNGKRRGGHTHAAAADNLGMHFASPAVHVDAPPPQVRPTATQLQRQAAYATWPQGVPGFSEAVAYCDNVSASLDSAAFAALADVARAGVGERSDRLNAGRKAGLRARASTCDQPLCDRITEPLVMPADKPHRVVSKRRRAHTLAERLGDVASEALPRSSTTGTYRDEREDGFKPPHLVWSASKERGRLAELMARTTRDFECAGVIPMDAPEKDNADDDDSPSVKPHHHLCCCEACGYSDDDENPAGFEDMGPGTGTRAKRASPKADHGPSKRCRGDEDSVSLGTTNYDFEPVAGPSGTLHDNNVLIEYNIDVPKEDDDMMYVPPYTPHAQCADACHAADANASLPRIYDEYLCTTVEKYHCISCTHVDDVALCVTCKGKTPCRNYWLLDSGASQHYTNNIDDYVDYTPWTRDNYGYVRTATTTTPVIGTGTVMIRVPGPKGTERTLQVHNVQHVPEMFTCLLSLSSFLLDDMDLGGNKNSIWLSRKGKTFLICHPRHKGDTLYGVNSDDYTEEVALKSDHVYKVDKHIMHQRFAHPSKDVLCKARRHTADFPDVDLQSPMPHLCDGCEQGKMTQRSFPPNDTRASRPFEVIHSDLKTYPINSVHNYKYVMTFFDDHSSHTWHTVLKTKKDAFNATKCFIKMVKVQFGADIEKWKCDWGGEYVLHAFKDLLKDHGIILEPSPPRTPQMNGRAERFMRTFSEKAEAMHLHACIPPSWWEFAVEHSIHVYNRTPLAWHDWKTPYEIIHKEKPLVKHLRAFGSGAYVFIPEEDCKKKLQPKAKLMTYIGWGPSGHCFMNKDSGERHMSKAKWDEYLFPHCKTLAPTCRTVIVSDKHDGTPGDEPVEEFDVDDIPVTVTSPSTKPAGAPRTSVSPPTTPPAPKTERAREPDPPRTPPAPSTSRKGPSAPTISRTSSARPPSPAEYGSDSLSSKGPAEQSPVQVRTKAKGKQPAAPQPPPRRSTRDRNPVVRPDNFLPDNPVAAEKETLRDFNKRVKQAGAGSSSVPLQTQQPGKVPGLPVLPRTPDVPTSKAPAVNPRPPASHRQPSVASGHLQPDTGCKVARITYWYRQFCEHSSVCRPLKPSRA
jgi:transposase InsO family protein